MAEKLGLSLAKACDYIWIQRTVKSGIVHRRYVRPALCSEVTFIHRL